MKIWRKLGKCVGMACLLALLLAPIGLLRQLSEQEMKQYEAPGEVELKVGAYGTIWQVESGDLEEYVEVDGTVISVGYAFQELAAYDLSDVRWLSGVGDIVTEGQLIGIAGNREIKAEYTGEIREINQSAEKPYINFHTYDDLRLECRVDSRTLSVLRSGELTDQEGGAAALEYVSPMLNEDGSVTVRIKTDAADLSVGQEIKEYRLSTGRVFSDVLMLPYSCVYRKESGENASWYARKLDSDGNFENEVQVEVGFQSGSMVSVNGVKEGEFYDGGYKAIVEEGLE